MEEDRETAHFLRIEELQDGGAFAGVALGGDAGDGLQVGQVLADAEPGQEVGLLHEGRRGQPDGAAGVDEGAEVDVGGEVLLAGIAEQIFAGDRPGRCRL